MGQTRKPREDTRLISRTVMDTTDKAPIRLAVRPDLLFEIVSGEGVAIASDRAQHVLCGPLYEGLFALLDGSRTRAEIAAELEPRFGMSPATSALRKLELLDLLAGLSEAPVPAAGSVPADSLVDADMVVREMPREIPEGLPEIEVRTVGELTVEPWASALRAHGFEIRESAELSIVLTDSYLRPELLFQVEGKDRVWLPVRPIGSDVWIGPRVEPGGSCIACLVERLRRNRPVETFLLDRTGRSPAALDPRGPDLVARLLATTLAGAPQGTVTDGFATHDPATGRSTGHQVRRWPLCRRCSPSASESVGVPRSAASAARSLLDLVDAVVGDVTEVRTIEPWPGTGLVAAEASFTGPPGGTGLPNLRRALKTSAGKGWTAEEATRGAIGEAVERRSATFRGDESRVRASLNALGDDAIDPNRQLLFSARQFADRETWNRQARRYNRVPPPFDPEEEIDWSPIRSLATDRERYLPTSMLYDDYPATEPGYCWFDPNGTAAASSLDDAMLRGLLELVERDAIAIWWYNRLQRPGVEYATVAGHGFADLERACSSVGREHWVLDLTTDLGIPVFAAVSRRVDFPIEEPLFGFGCHPDPQEALSHALTEMNQMIVRVRAARSGPTGVGVELASWFRTATTTGEPYLAPSDESSPRLVESDDRRTSDSADDLNRCRQILERARLETFALDLTRSDTAVPVARIVVPGLRSFYARFGSGRLYEVPVAAGWLREPVAEGNLNPVSFLL